MSALAGALCQDVSATLLHERPHPTEWTWSSLGALPAEPVPSQAQLLLAVQIRARPEKASLPSIFLICYVDIIPLPKRAVGRFR